MPDSIRERYRRWQLEELLGRHPSLRVVPSGDDALILRGDIGFRLQGPNHGPIEDTFTVELRVPPSFPEELPTARETGGRIPASFHQFEGGLLCLGAPTALRVMLTQSPTLPTYIDGLLVPYLFGYSYFAQHRELPFGELAHGRSGILEYLAELFESEQNEQVHEFLRLASLKRRDANKYLCPCRSGRRLGLCHNGRVNDLRKKLGRRWFMDEYSRVIEQHSRGKTAVGSELHRLVGQGSRSPSS